MRTPIVKENSAHDAVIPRIFPTLKQKVLPLLGKKTTAKQFNVFHPSFAALANERAFSELRTSLIEIDIRDEIAMMNENSNLEVNVPVQGITDLFNASGYFNKLAQFAPVMGFNGFGAASDATLKNNYPQADFIVATDIVGNQFEILVNPDGSIDLPEEGLGLFTLLSAITFIYNYQQVTQGFGLQNLNHVGLKPKKLYLLPPLESFEAFDFNVSVTHIDHRHHRIVDSIRTVDIHFHTPVLDTVSFQSCAIKDAADNMQIQINRLATGQMNQPFSLSVELQGEPGTQYVLCPHEHNSDNWKKHPVLPNVFMKHYGLSTKTFLNIIKKLYSENKLCKYYLKGDSFGLSHDRNYNDFIISPFALGYFYDRLMHDFAYQKISGDFLFERISIIDLLSIDTSRLSMNLHDSIVFAQLHSQWEHHHFEGFTELFLNPGNKNVVDNKEQFMVATLMKSQRLPKVHLAVIPSREIDPAIVSDKEYIDATQDIMEDEMALQHRQKEGHQHRDRPHRPRS